MTHAPAYHTLTGKSPNYVHRPPPSLGRRAFAFPEAAMSALTAESIDYALRATREKWLAALSVGDFARAEKIQARLDELLDQRCAVVK